MIVDFADEAENWFSTETGVSENAIHTNYYYNQHDNHISGDLIPMQFDK